MISRAILIKLHHPGEHGWQDTARLPDVEEASSTLDRPPSLVTVRLRPGVGRERAKQIAALFKSAIDDHGNVEIVFGGDDD